MEARADVIRTIAVVGHRGAGKTSLIEAMLYLARAAPRPPRAGERAPGFDDTPEEKRHGATFQVRASTLRWDAARIHLIDTPGEPSFFADVELALSVTDAALLVVSARDGVDPGTERLVGAIRDRGLPCLAVVTRCDEAGARIDEVIGQLRALKAPASVMEVPHRGARGFDGVVDVHTRHAWFGRPETPADHRWTGVPSELAGEVEAAHARLVDEVAATDDTLTDRYLTDGDMSDAELDDGVRRAVIGGKLVPVFLAAPAVPSGVTAILDDVVRLLPAPAERAAWTGRDGQGQPCALSPSADGPVAAAVFHTEIDPHAGRMSTVRVLSGVLRPDVSLLAPGRGQRERIPQLLQGVGKELRAVEQAVAGEIVHLPRLKHTGTRDSLCDERSSFTLDFPPPATMLYARAIVAGGEAEQQKVVAAATRQVEEDVGLAFSHGDRELVLSAVGALHLDLAIERLQRRTGLELRVGPPRIPYRETVTRAVRRIEGKQKKQTGGHGQFAVCYLDVEPLPRGAGFEFENAVVGGAVPRPFIPSVEKGIRRAMAEGAVAGYPVVDVRVRLVDGRAHSVDSSDAAFQTAAARGFRLAARTAAPVLLEPVMRLVVTVPADDIGAVLGELAARNGRTVGTDSDGQRATIIAHVPLGQLADYEPALRGLTRGRGQFTYELDHYAPCPPTLQQRIVRDSGFAADAAEA